MDLELPEEVRLLKETLRRFVDRELIPIEMQAMDGPDLKPEVRAGLEAKTKEMGLWLLDTPAEFGGQGLSLLALAAVWEEVARTVALPPRGPGIFGPSVISILLTLPEAQREKYLLPVLRGEKTTAFAQTEPDAGSDPAHMRTRAVRQGDHYVINGYKRFIQHAGEADFVQLIAVTDPEKGARGGLSVFLVDTDSPGFSIAGRSVHMMGDVTYEIALDDVKVPVENLIGKEGDGMKHAQGWIGANRIHQAARGLGVTERCLEMIGCWIGANRIHQAARGLGVTERCLEMIGSYAKQRKTFGRALADRQAVQFALADLYTRHQAGQLLMYRTAARIDAGSAARHETYMAKIYCTELGFEAADRCMQFHGAMGLSTEMPIERFWRQSRSFMITGGAVEVMRATLARELFELYD